MLERVATARGDSDTALFYNLLFAGELVLKLTVAGFVSSLDDDREQHRYRILHRLVRADGLGEWAQSLDELLTGPASQHMCDVAKEDRRSYTERLGPEAWQFKAVYLLRQVLSRLGSGADQKLTVAALRDWFAAFTELRNKTRGHGAPTASMCSAMCPDLEESLTMLCDRSPLFHRQWAYLHRNLSGKYRVIPLNDPSSEFEHLKTSAGIAGANLKDGVYVSFSGPRWVDLIQSSADVDDFFAPNGAFSEKRFELHSLISDARKPGDATPYLRPASERPESETQGLRRLDVIGKTWTNIPRLPGDYIPRPNLETEIGSELSNDRHPVVTLVGRGGIGKTSLALKCLRDVAHTGRFEAIIWFSARDIDLIATGPKVVKPHVLTHHDIANEFSNLLEPSGRNEKQFNRVKFLADNLCVSQLGGPILFVFDNFETVRSPVDIFNWIDANVRSPNKVLITSRFREFKADYPIEVSGMERKEAEKLIDVTAARLGVSSLVTGDWKDELIEQSDGHPYVIKIILGEVADTKRLGKPERIIARKDEILDAIFERTYANLTPAAKRVFLTLCGWRSLVPQLALEAVLIRPDIDLMDVSGAVDELVRLSLIERKAAPDGQDFLDVPLAAAVFGHRKLGVAPDRAAIEADIEFLQQIGPTSDTSLKEGLHPRVERLFSRIADRVSAGATTLQQVESMLELIARNYPPAWLMLADLHDESGDPAYVEYLRRYLEQERDDRNAREGWHRLADYYKRNGMVVEAADALVRGYEPASTDFYLISNAANWLNNNERNEREMLKSSEDERRRVFRELIRLMENRIGEASATDLSRLAWMHLHVSDVRRAHEVATMGTRREPTNQYCARLSERLEKERPF